MQDVSFRTVGELLDFLPENECKIVELLRDIILETIPECSEKLSYNVPFYTRHYRICFIWPGSVPWGKVKVNGVQLGFAYGYLLPDDAGYLEKGSRKQMYGKTFTDISQVNVELVRSFLYDAVAVDDALQQARRERANRKR